jgi:CheY-like chemotaxis protein/anti-sigma regulatory factor (Ser/Thr protein kinase)
MNCLSAEKPLGRSEHRRRDGNGQGAAMNHILVVDDSGIDSKLASRLLERGTGLFIEYASNGLEALEHLDARLPLAVVTDLQMPEMDGMQLVRKIHQKYPTVPVILMTAFGSEDIAVQALMEGAADYVPKSKLATELVEAVQSVLEITSSDRPHKRLAQCLRYEERRYEIDNDILLIPPLVNQLKSAALELSLVDETDALRLAKAVAEALSNAIYHGNLELDTGQVELSLQASPSDANPVKLRRQTAPYSDRRVFVQAQFSPSEARISIRDQGPGFEVHQVAYNIHRDPTQLTRLEGRGLVLIHMFMDEVTFTDGGREITLIKRPAQTTTPQ